VGSELEGVGVRGARRLARGLLEESDPAPRVLTLRDRGVLADEGGGTLEDADEEEELQERERRKSARRSRADIAVGLLAGGGILPQYDEFEDEGGASGGQMMGGKGGEREEEDLVLGRGGDLGHVLRQAVAAEPREERWDLGEFDREALELPLLGKQVAREFRGGEGGNGYVQVGRGSVEGAREWRRGTVGAKRGRRFLHELDEDGQGVLDKRNAVAEENFRHALEAAEKKSADALRKRPAALSVLSLAKRIEDEKQNEGSIDGRQGGRDALGNGSSHDADSVGSGHKGVVISSMLELCRELERSAAAAKDVVDSGSGHGHDDNHGKLGMMPMGGQGSASKGAEEPVVAEAGEKEEGGGPEKGVDIDLGDGLAAALALLQQDGAILKPETVAEPLFLRSPHGALPTSSAARLRAPASKERGGDGHHHAQASEDADEVGALAFPDLPDDIVRRDKKGHTLTPKEAYLDLSRRLDRARAWNKRRQQQKSAPTS